MQVCARCQCKRDLAAFGDDSICSSCKLREPFEACLCGICGKIKSMKDMRETVLGSGNFLCSACAPNLRLFKCTACHEVKTATNFHDFRQGLSTLEKRRSVGARRVKPASAARDTSTTSATSRRMRDIAAPATKD